MDKDERFKHITTDPKFRRIPKSERKVKIDKRFKSMFSDEKFKLKYTVDKRGRPVNHTSTEDLKRYYELNSDDSESSNDENEASNDENEASNDENEASIDENEKSGSSSDKDEAGTFILPPKKELKKKKNEDKNIGLDIKKKLKDLSVDYARGESTIAESSSDDETSEEEFSDDEVDHGWGELDKDADKTEEATTRLAVCNQDWDRIRAVDIMMLFNSFIPTGGVIHSVTIYPSDFGLERMKEEETKGPIELMKNDEESEEETEEGSKYHMEKLRRYQLNRLKYFYAVVICDSAETANKIYTECDGMEYESSATKIDVRFIPEDMNFENKPKEICAKMPERYEPRFFTTTALQQAKVELTWDETNPERLEITKKLASGKIDDVTEADLQTYLASSSGEESEIEDKKNEENSDSEEDIKNPIDKYRALLLDIENTEKEKDNKGVEMEISWGINAKEKTEKLVKKKLAEKEEKTPFQQYLDKRKDKIKAKREERKKKSENSDEDSDIPSDIDMNDPYFAEEFASQEFKKPKSKKQQKGNKLEEETEKEKAELELLLLNENEDTKRHFNLKQIQDDENKSKNKKKRKKGKKGKEEVKYEDEFQVDVKDDRFSALFSSHHYNIDPTDSRYKKTKAMEELIKEKLKRRTNDEKEESSPKKAKKDAELSVLVKSIKRKTHGFGNKK